MPLVDRCDVGRRLPQRLWVFGGALYEHGVRVVDDRILARVFLSARPAPPLRRMSLVRMWDEADHPGAAGSAPARHASAYAEGDGGR
ncbi:hypothetical protein OG203_41505 [Nocardia sp. NBC_01499]|uniref:hypothetical protein n=1 Tax=Nocardia sp. NBC_01499 TaxID=2903597 RepID=UPI00386BCB60